MDYSNESFEAFQARLRTGVPEDSLLWQLRDALFAEAFYGKSRAIDRANRLPGGWLLSLALQWREGRRLAVGDLAPAPGIKRHFLFVSDRNNHTRRLHPLLLEQRTGAPSRAWYVMPGVRRSIPSEAAGNFVSACGRWTRHVRGKDLVSASRLARELATLFPADLDAVALAKIRIYLVQFLAWCRFWNAAIADDSEMVISTFEKAAHVKAFFHVAWRKGVPRRIHWIHGLRHVSIQATLATELWCMTPGDVRFFAKRVPDFCTPSVKRNPESDELIAKVGRVDPVSLPALERLHFLFLGPGTEASYTRDMRMADLAVIRAAQKRFGERVVWRFRPHPSCIDRFRDELAEAGVAAEDFSTGDLNDDLRWAHAVGSSWSSLLLDVRETGRPIFWVQNEIRNLGAVDELIADGIGEHFNAETMDKVLGRCLGNFPA